MPKNRLKPEHYDNLFAPTEPKKKVPPYDRKYARHTYRVEDSLHDLMKEIAEREKISLNELVRWWLGELIRRYRANEIEVPVEEYTVTKRRLPL